MSRVVIGVDLGGTKILAGVVTADGQILRTLKQPTLSERGAEDILDRISAGMEELMAGLSQADTLAGIAVGAPGPLFYPQGIISTTPNLGWDSLDLKKGLSRRLGRPVLVDNDANLAALAEARFGKYSHCNHLLYLTISTGIGGGIIINRQIYRGRDGGAGEFGHIIVSPGGPLCRCGRQGCLEAMASGTALARQAQELISGGGGRKIRDYSSGQGMPTAREVGEAARAGDPEALLLVYQLAQHLGLGITNLVHIFNPEIVVLGGGMALGMGDLLLKPLTEHIQAHAFSMHSARLPVVLASLGDQAGLIGCAAAVMEAGENSTQNTRI